MMITKGRPIDEQVIVITGASSGIGMACAQMAAECGAKVVLCARSQPKLERIVDDLRQRGLEATYAVADVTEPEQLEHVVEVAEERYGGIDTWFNNAALSIFGPVEEVSSKDAHRLFEINFFGVVNGCRAALPALRRRGGGVLINMGSVLADRAIALQGFYSATKHAVKAYTDALRMELERDDEPIAVCLIKPASINTPYSTHGMNLLDVEPSLPAPVYDPKVVARGFLEICERPRRDLYIGGAARAIAALAALFPRASDFVSEWFFFDAQKNGSSADAPWEGTLYTPPDDEEPRIDGNIHKHIMSSSLYTQAKLHPLKTLAAGLLGAGAAWAASRARN